MEITPLWFRFISEVEIQIIEDALLTKNHKAIKRLIREIKERTKVNPLFYPSKEVKPWYEV